MRILLLVIFSCFCTLAFCQYQTNTKQSRAKAIQLYNDYVKGDTLPFHQIKVVGKNDSTISLEYTSKNAIKSILVQDRIIDNSYTETLYWFSQGNILHIYINLKLKNQKGQWKDKGFGSYIFFNNQVLFSDEKKILHQNMDLLLNRSRLLYANGLERIRDAN
jgi:hypothetical protein